MEMSRGGILPHELAFDIDGVVADSFRVFVQVANEQYGFQVEYEDITEYDFRMVIDIDEEVSQEVVRQIMDEPLEIGIRPFRGAIQVLSRLLNFGPLLFVTARPTREPILAWIQNHIGLDDP